MACHELVRRIAIAVLAPALGQHIFVLRFQHGEPPNLFKIAGEAGFGRQNWQCCSTGHCSALQKFAPGHTGGRSAPSLPEPTVHIHAATAKTDRAATLQDKRGPKEVNSASRHRDPSVCA
jgi:hypothetical protein